MMVIQRLDSRTQGTVGHCCPLAMNRMVWRMVQRYLVGLMEGVQTDNRVLIEMFVGLHRMRYRHQAGRNCAMMVRYGRLGRLTHGRQQIQHWMDRMNYQMALANVMSRLMMERMMHPMLVMHHRHFHRMLIGLDDLTLTQSPGNWSLDIQS